MENHPLIRLGLDFFTHEAEGQKMIGLRDPLNLAPEIILVPPHAFFLITQMDGKNSCADLQAIFTREFTEKVELEQIEALVASLEAKGFLDGPAFQQKKQTAIEDFQSQKVRTSFLAGQAYPGDRQELETFLSETLTQAREEDKNKEPHKQHKGPPAAIIAPHIDLHRGLSLFGKAYNGLEGQPPPETILILGTAHYGEGGLYILSVKDFETPLGLSPVDREFCDILKQNCKQDLSLGEFAHQSEHSIEFQVLFLQHIFRNHPQPKIVPVLCGSLVESLVDGQMPDTLEEMNEFVQGVERARAACSGPVLVVAGADMCHVGTKFGTPERLSADYLDRVRNADLAALTAAEAGDGDGFYQRVARIKNRNNICSVASIYTLLKIVQPTSGRLLGYDLAVDQENDSAVGFTALNFWS